MYLSNVHVTRAEVWWLVPFWIQDLLGSVAREHLIESFVHVPCVVPFCLSLSDATGFHKERKRLTYTDALSSTTNVANDRLKCSKVNRTTAKCSICGRVLTAKISTVQHVKVRTRVIFSITWGGHEMKTATDVYIHHQNNNFKRFDKGLGSVQISQNAVEPHPNLLFTIIWPH